MTPLRDPDPRLPVPPSRRAFLGRFGLGLGGIALSGLWTGEAPGAAAVSGRPRIAPSPIRIPKAHRVISLFMAGGPGQHETFDPKPKLVELNGTELPASVRMGQRLTGMSGNQATLPLAGSVFKAERHGQCGAWVGELLPHTARIVDDLCIVRSLHTEAINHDPAITFFQTGSQISGRPSMGAWLDYGLGSLNRDLPAFVVLITPGKVDQPLYARLWGSGFLPSRHQGVQFRSGAEPVPFLANPPGIDAAGRREFLEALADLHRAGAPAGDEPEFDACVARHELAFRMQTSVPEVMDISGEPESVLDLYGPDVRKPRTFARHCLLARRLAERGVRFVQLYHQGWDHHGNLPAGMRTQCRETDQPCAGLVQDLKQRGLLNDTLVVWGGEFGRTAYSQGKLSAGDYGRDHHPRCFTMWLAGGGSKPGLTFGETCDLGYNIVKDPVHVHDLQATILHLLGIDHEKLTYRHQGRDYRLTDVHGRVVNDLIA